MHHQQKIMKRTQTYLDDDIYGFLKEESRQYGVTVSELVCRHISERMENALNQSKIPKRLSSIKKITTGMK